MNQGRYEMTLVRIHLGTKCVETWRGESVLLCTNLHTVTQLCFNTYEPRNEKMCLRESPIRLDTN